MLLIELDAWELILAGGIVRVKPVSEQFWLHGDFWACVPELVARMDAIGIGLLQLFVALRGSWCALRGWVSLLGLPWLLMLSAVVVLARPTRSHDLLLLLIRATGICGFDHSTLGSNTAGVSLCLRIVWLLLGLMAWRLLLGRACVSLSTWTLLLISETWVHINLTLRQNL